MRHNKFRSLALFSFCLLVILSSSLLLRSIVTERTENVALVVGATESNERTIEKINILTTQAERLTRSVRNSLALRSYRDRQRRILNDEVLTARKNSIIDLLLKGGSTDQIVAPSASLSRIADSNLIEKAVTITGNIVASEIYNFENKEPNYLYTISDDLNQYTLISNQDLRYITGITTVKGVAFGSILYTNLNGVVLQ